MEWKDILKKGKKIKRVEKLVDMAAETYFDFPKDICDELNELTGNTWEGKEYIPYCAGYWESPWSLEEVVYALFHDGEFPDKKEEKIYAWSTNGNDDNTEDVISFFRFGRYNKNPEKKGNYMDIDAAGCFNELMTAFFEWDCDDAEKENYNSFYCSIMKEYGYEKNIHIYNGYDHKFLNCTITNLDKEEKDKLVTVIGKWCNCIAGE